MTTISLRNDVAGHLFNRASWDKESQFRKAGFEICEKLTDLEFIRAASQADFSSLEQVTSPVIKAILGYINDKGVDLRSLVKEDVETIEEASPELRFARDYVSGPVDVYHKAYSEAEGRGVLLLKSPGTDDVLGAVVDRDGFQWCDTYEEMDELRRPLKLKRGRWRTVGETTIEGSVSMKQELSPSAKIAETMALLFGERDGGWVTSIPHPQGGDKSAYCVGGRIGVAELWSDEWDIVLFAEDGSGIEDELGYCECFDDALKAVAVQYVELRIDQVIE